MIAKSISIHPLRISALVLFTMLAITLPVHGSSAVRDTTAVHLFSDGSAVAGSSSTLVRNSNGVYMTLHTSGLPAGDAVTIWWVIFNNPAACSHGMFALRCGHGDFSNPDVKASVMYAAGQVIGGDGVGNYGAGLSVGELTRVVLFGPGLTNSMGADVHLVVHDHGPADPSLMPDEIHSFDVCNTKCVDLQFAPHEA